MGRWRFTGLAVLALFSIATCAAQRLDTHPVPIFLTIKDDCGVVVGNASTVSGSSVLQTEDHHRQRGEWDAGSFLNRVISHIGATHSVGADAAGRSAQARPLLRLYEGTVKRFGCTAVVSGFLPASYNELKAAARAAKRSASAELEVQVVPASTSTGTDGSEDADRATNYEEEAKESAFVIQGALTRRAREESARTSRRNKIPGHHSQDGSKRGRTHPTISNTEVGERLLIARELIAKQYRIAKALLKKRGVQPDAEPTERIFLDYNFRIRTTQGFVEDVTDVTFGVSATVPWHLDRLTSPFGDQIYAPPAAYRNASRRAARMYVVDTGVLETHQEFIDPVSGQSRVSYVYDHYPSLPHGCNVHGTHVAGIMGGRNVGVNNNSRIYAARALDCDGNGDYSGVLAALYAIRAHCQPTANDQGSVVNLSLGGGSITDYSLVQSLADIFTTLRSECDMFIAVSAGNDAADACQTLPAGLSAPDQGRVFTVAASTQTDDYAYFTNWGTCVAIVAPGYQVYSAISSATNAYGILSGTSMASPVAAGVASLHMEERPLNWFTLAASSVKSNVLVFSDAVRIKMLSDAASAMNPFAHSSVTTNRLIQLTTPLSNYTTFIPALPPYNGNFSEIIYIPDPPTSISTASRGQTAFSALILVLVGGLCLFM